MTIEEIHQRVATLGDFVSEHIALLETDLPKDAEGFTNLPKDELGEALRVLQQVDTILARLAYRIGWENRS